MALTYLSGDYMGKAKDKRKAKKKARQEKKGKEPSKKGKKAKGKGKVVKIALVPARGAFLTIVSLNLFGTGKKLAKLWVKTGGKQKITDLWVGKFKGDIDKLKKAISAGSKTSISGVGEEIGVAPAVLVATALPIVIAIAKLVKENGIDPETQAELESAISSGKTELSDNTEDYSSDGGDGTTKGSFFSAFGMCFWGVMICMMLQNTSSSIMQNPILANILSLIGSYFVIGIPLGMIYQNESRFKKYIAWYFDIPKNLILNLFSYGKKSVQQING